jgi:hypothetical protein
MGWPVTLKLTCGAAALLSTLTLVSCDAPAAPPVAKAVIPAASPNARPADPEALKVLASQKGKSDAPLGICTTDPAIDGECQENQAMFLKAWAKAWRGDYQGQRNVAFCQAGKCGAGIAPNRVQGCAWRIVILASGSTEVGDADVQNMKLECGKLDQVGRAAADAQAREIARKLAAS